MKNLQNLLHQIVQSPKMHAQWLNTLSMMENTGARKIARAEHPTRVTEDILKHAAEEARHAWYLKKQISKLEAGQLADYQADQLLLPHKSAAYLRRLDVEVCRKLIAELGLSGAKLRHAAYLLVTYGIEVRAMELYPLYQEVLEAHSSPVTVKSIIAEEKGHLDVMQAQMEEEFNDVEYWKQAACQIEEQLYQAWTHELEQELVN